MPKVVKEEAYVVGRVVLIELLETRHRHQPRFSFDVQADESKDRVTVYMEPPHTHSPEVFNAVVAIITAAYISKASVLVDYSKTPDPDDSFERMGREAAYEFKAIELPDL